MLKLIWLILWLFNIFKIIWFYWFYSYYLNISFILKLTIIHFRFFLKNIIYFIKTWKLAEQYPMRLHENWNEINIYFKIIIENNKLIQIFYFHKNNMRQLWLVNTQIFYEYTNLLLFLKWPIKAMLHKSDAALYVWPR